jgi:dipeptidyl aminopeptidase/acylaminoacyl peptidase
MVRKTHGLTCSSQNGIAEVLVWFRNVITGALACIAMPACAAPSITPAEVLQIPQVSAVDISRDGNRIAFVVTDLPSAADHRQTHVWIVATDGSSPAAPIRTDLLQESAPTWSPDGKSLAFLAQPSPSETAKQIALFQIVDGSIRKISKIQSGVDSFAWSPDGRWIAFLAKQSAATAPKENRVSASPYEADRLKAATHLWILDSVNGEARPITEGQLQVNDFCWSPDSSRLAIRVSDTSRRDDMFWHSRLVVVERSSGRQLSVLTQRASPWEGTLEWSPDGKAVAFPEFTKRRIAAWLTIASVDGMQKRRIGTAYPGTIRVEKWTPDSKYFLAQATHGTMGEIIRIDATTGATVKLARYFGSASSANFSLSGSGHAIAYLCAKPDAPADICLLELGETSRRITDFHRQLSASHFPDAREITWKSHHDQRTIYGVLYTPSNKLRDRTYPTIVLVHGGPLEAWVTGWNNWAELLASHGYVVLLSNPRGSEGQGWRFAEADYKDWGGGDFQDILDGVDQLVVEKIADPARLGIGGRSFGGFMTAWAVTQTPRFKAAVIGAGITDLLSFNGEASISPSFLDIYFGGYAYQQWPLYERHSPARHLGKVVTPTLIMHGTGDDVVDDSQSWEFYRGLKTKGVETELILYPGEWHVLEKPANQADEMTRMLSWFDRHLK